MSCRSLFLAGSFALAAIPTGFLFAEEPAQQQPDVQNSKFQFEGVINAPSVYIRSGPGEGYYTTQKMDKGAPITVVGIKFDWLKIVPPEGSFCYIAKGFVDRHGDGKTGRVNKADVNIRAGSLVNTMKTTVQSRLNVGDEVQIIEEVDEYFKIKPPTGAYLYISKQFVDPIKAAATVVPVPPITTNIPTPPTPGPGPGPAITITPNGVITDTAPTHPTAPQIDTTAVAPAPTTQQTQVAVVPPTTQPELTAEEKFGTFETEYNTISSQPLAEQPVETLVKKYQSIAKAEGLSDAEKHIIDIRVATLNARADSKVKLAALRRDAKEAAEKQFALDGENRELQEKIAQTRIDIYAAVGTVQPSSLQLAGGGTLYRLTDPANGRTLIYVRSTDNKLGAMVGQFIGVKGTPGNDPQLPLRIITPTNFQKVDVANIKNNTVAATIVPPSLILSDITPVSKAE